MISVRYDVKMNISIKGYIPSAVICGGPVGCLAEGQDSHVSAGEKVLDTWGRIVPINASHAHQLFTYL